MPSGTLEQLPSWAADLLESERVAHLGALDATGHPRVLPVTYAISERAVWTVIDNKPKVSSEPARLGWLRADGRAAITVDRYDDDWSALKWVQLLGYVTVFTGAPEGPGFSALVTRYPQYQLDPPPGPLLRLRVERAVWWRAG